VEGGILPPGMDARFFQSLTQNYGLWLAQVFSAGLEAPALRQARMPAATGSEPMRDITRANQTPSSE